MFGSVNREQQAVERLRLAAQMSEAYYLRAFDKMLEMRAARGKMDGSWRAGTTGEDVFRWWLQDRNIVGQMKIEGFDE